MEVSTPSPLLLKFRLGRQSLALQKPRIASSPGPWATYPYLHQTEMLLFGKASVTSLQWGLWDNTLG